MILFLEVMHNFGFFMILLFVLYVNPKSSLFNDPGEFFGGDFDIFVGALSDP